MRELTSGTQGNYYSPLPHNVECHGSDWDCTTVSFVRVTVCGFARKSGVPPSLQLTVDEEPVPLVRNLFIHVTSVYT